jgi:hypothetical protein
LRMWRQWKNNPPKLMSEYQSNEHDHKNSPWGALAPSRTARRNVRDPATKLTTNPATIIAAPAGQNTVTAEPIPGIYKNREIPPDQLKFSKNTNLPKRYKPK